jgi:secreted trypsin-like serine protease
VVVTTGEWLTPVADALAPAMVGGSARVIAGHAYGVKVGAFARGQLQFECGGVLIDLEWMLRVAHRTEYQPTGTYFSSVDSLGVIFGQADLSAVITGPNELLAFSERIYRHPHYDSFTLEIDIALVRLETPVSPAHAATIPIYDFGRLADGDPAVVAGWGATQTGGYTTDKSMGAEVALDLTCVGWPAVMSPWNDDAHLCASNIPTSFCQGDSGGPLVVNVGCITSLIGLVSFNSAVGFWVARARPDVHTRVSTYVEWIESLTGSLWQTVSVDASETTVVTRSG